MQTTEVACSIWFWGKLMSNAKLSGAPCRGNKQAELKPTGKNPVAENQSFTEDRISGAPVREGPWALKPSRRRRRLRERERKRKKEIAKKKQDRKKNIKRTKEYLNREKPKKNKWTK